MRRSCSILVLFLLLAFGVSVAVPAEDVPETAYDESESLPCEVTPLFSIAVAKAVEAAPAVLTGASPRCFDAVAENCGPYRERRAGALHAVLDSLTILNSSLRC
jgi:hypothetical protein